MSDVMTITVHDDLTVTLDTLGLSMTGEQLLDITAAAIASVVRGVEQIWTTAGADPDGAVQAGQCAINRAGVLLRGRHRMIAGHAVVSSPKDGRRT